MSEADANEATRAMANVDTPAVATASFVVTSGGDVTDPGDGTLTLREAVAVAKDAGVSATITFAAGIDTVLLKQGEIDIDGTSLDRGVKLVIDGGGTSGVPGVRIAQETAGARLLHIDGSAGVQDVALHGVSLQQGQSLGANGGGLLAEKAVLEISDSTILQNVVDREPGQAAAVGGGGIALIDSATTILRSTIGQNEIVSTASSDTVQVKGGGIYAAGGTLTVTDSAVSDNTGNVDIGFARGGGIYANVDKLVVNGTTVTGNQLQSASSSGDSAQGGGIGLVGGTATISYSAISGNSATGYRSGEAEGGGVAIENGTLAIDHSYLGKNTAAGVDTAGGGIAAFGSALSLANSTIFGNGVDAGFRGGGGVYLRNGSASIVGATITGNTAPGAATHGGGIAGAYVVPVIHNSIVAGNSAGYAIYADVFGTIASNGHNLFRQAAVGGAAAGDLLGTDPGLRPLAANGGPTPTMGLLAGSKAIDGGLDADALGATDQRGTGFSRLSGAHTDIGAFEVQTIGGAMRLFTPGDDAIDLRKANLTLYPGALGSDALAGDDTVYLSNTQNLGKLFIAGQGEDTLFGGSRDDKITGSQGDDRIGGGGGDDLLYGGIGNDRLHGDGGADTLKGSAGEDTFIFTKVGDSPAGAGRDVILDFTSRQGDLVDLAKIDANAGLAGNQAFVWKGDDPLTGVGQLHYRHVDGDTIVEGNVSGSAAPEIQIELHGHLTLAAGDFLL